LIALFRRKDTPFCALIDDVVFQHQTTVVTDHFAAGLVTGKASASAVAALYDIFYLLFIHFSSLKHPLAEHNAQLIRRTLIYSLRRLYLKFQQKHSAIKRAFISESCQKSTWFLQKVDCKPISTAVNAPEPIISAGLMNEVEGQRCGQIGHPKKSL
jgi:hypothetical protein